MASVNHRSQDYGSRAVNGTSSQVNDIRPFEIKVQYRHKAEYCPKKPWQNSWNESF